LTVLLAILRSRLPALELVPPALSVVLKTFRACAVALLMRGYLRGLLLSLYVVRMSPPATPDGITARGVWDGRPD
jgi:hypothetical protein